MTQKTIKYPDIKSNWIMYYNEKTDTYYIK